MKQLFILTLLGLCATADKVDFYETCDSPSGSITELDVEGCTSKPCILHRGGQAKLEVKFKSSVSSDTLTASMKGVIGGAEIPWNGIPSDACTGTTCPISAGNSYTYAVKFDVLKSYPAIPVDVKMELKDADSKNVVCFKVAVKLA